jgi:hypothetical protein
MARPENKMPYMLFKTGSGARGSGEWYAAEGVQPKSLIPEYCIFKDERCFFSLSGKSESLVTPGHRSKINDAGHS